MGIPTWAARNSNPNNGGGGGGAGQVASNRFHPVTPPASKFPVHRIEDSPTLALYQTQSAASDQQSDGRGLDPVSLLPRCRPDEVLFKVKSVRFEDGGGGVAPSVGVARKEQRKMVELTPSDDLAKEVQVTTNKLVPNLLPTSTMVMGENRDAWYRKFSRNLHGLRGDKPYAHLQWPPPPTTTSPPSAPAPPFGQQDPPGSRQGPF